jgi:peptidyl-prolyl isomerase E (cyclophilin E)
MPGNNKKTLYVGGLEANVTEEIVFAAFIPFGDIKEVSMPRDFSANKHKGFAFIEYEDEEDAQEAIENMVKSANLFY